jgi:2'-5' RNA ligase
MHMPNDKRCPSVLTSKFFIGFPVVANYVHKHPGYSELSLLEPVDLVDLHITISFFGVTTEDTAWQAWSCLQPIGFSRIECIPANWQLMGPPECPNSYALVLESVLNRLHDAISAWRHNTHMFLHKSDYDFPLLPHLTMYRYKNKGTGHFDHKTILRQLSLMSFPLLKGFAVEEVALYRSSNGSHGRRYDILERRRFS